jgi:hypothetical protein
LLLVSAGEVHKKWQFATGKERLDALFKLNQI